METVGRFMLALPLVILFVVQMAFDWKATLKAYTVILIFIAWIAVAVYLIKA